MKTIVLLAAFAVSVLVWALLLEYFSATKAFYIVYGSIALAYGIYRLIGLFRNHSSKT